MNNRLSVRDAAKLMQVSEQFIRIGLQREKLPFGYAIKTSRYWTYYISPTKFTEFTGIQIKNEGPHAKENPQYE